MPSIGVDAPIEMVGLDSNGRMEVPTRNQWSDVGWYSNGTPPGAQGSAVIDGHLDTNTGAPAVFWKLNALHVGDLIMVRDNAGRKAQFRVFKLQSYDIDQAPLNEIFARTDGVYLNLITCAGSWDYSRNQFQQRLVVFTQLV
jgi:sortase (surface protein transpeptidase)